MNTRHIVTRKAWFGGGADLTPIYPDPTAAEEFHAVLAGACDGYEPDAYVRFKKWCDDYFFLPHRGETRGVGGIFFDYLETHPDETFHFVRDCGDSFLNAYGPIVNSHKADQYTQAQKAFQEVRRGRFAEFNLLY